jgi:DNA-binding MarR family transcriptional regulator
VKQLHNEVLPYDALARLFALAAMLGDVMDAGLTERGMTRARAEVIWELHHRGPLTQRELSQALQCTPRNVTGLIDALQSAGYVARSVHPTDRRATLVSLTEQGSVAAADWQAGYRDAAKRLFDGIPARDLATFVATLDQVLGRLRELPGRT